MTVLNFMFDKKHLFLVTDSTFSDANDKLPRGYCTKAYCLPHLDGIIAGTGRVDFIISWVMEANTGFSVRDMPHLNQFATGTLNKMYAQYITDREVADTTTLYHFGYDRRERRMRCFVYRSTNNFQSEELPFGSAVKPGIDFSSFPIANFPGDYLPIIEAQKASDLALPVEERVGVGGHMIAYTIRADTREDGMEDVIINTWKSSAISDVDLGWRQATAR